MKIKRIRIQNYKSIVDQELDGFTHVNMLFGHNNSGKSNILKFLDLIFMPKINQVTTVVDTSRMTDKIEIPQKEISPWWDGIIENQPFIFRNNDWKNPIVFEVDLEIDKSVFSGIDTYFEKLEAVYFAINPVLLTIKGSIVGHDRYSSEIKLEEVNLNKMNIYKRSPEEVYFESVPDPDDTGLKSSGYQILSAILNIFTDSVLLLDNDRYFNYERENQLINDLNHNNFKNWFHNISLSPERYEEFKSIVKEMGTYHPTGDDKFNGNETNSPFQNLTFEFSRVGDQIQILFKNGLGNRFPLESFGTGIQQILYILAKISEKKPRLLLVEEIELNLSPKYQLELIGHLLRNYLEKTGTDFKQLIFTTHSPLLCYRADFQIHKISINNKGETNATKLGKDKIEIAKFYPTELQKYFENQAK